MSSFDDIGDKFARVELVLKDLHAANCAVISFYATSGNTTPRVHIRTPTPALEDALDYICYSETGLPQWTELGCTLHGCRVFWLAGSLEAVMRAEAGSSDRFSNASMCA